MRNYRQLTTALLVVPIIALFYIGLFLTMQLWYPSGLELSSWYAHLFHFTVVYLMWLVVLFSYRLFDWDSLRTTQTFLARLLGALLACLVIAVLYFYFQPNLLITPRRFLLVHLLISGVGIFIWYMIIRNAAIFNRRSNVYIHSSHPSPGEAQSLIEQHGLLGLNFAGTLQPNSELVARSIVVVPTRAELSQEDSTALFALRNQGIRFVEYHELYESLTRTVHLSVLNELWFLQSIDYGSHQLFDALKRIIDIVLGLLGTVVFLVTLPVIAALIKITPLFTSGKSSGGVFFSQQRVGQNGRVFTLYKYRTMDSAAVNNTWTQRGDSRITGIGRALRALRLDELPQSLNILKGDMSIVGPRPEQVNIVKELEAQIPYYAERHTVKPGLTGWAQLHVYAGSLEETRRKLQYDLYYVKHRSLLFDLEIIIKTFYNVITFSGR
ncbi:MAG TPA: sugar transferase [Patescibacteria group bacterium]|jgi:lipopolysaccharide/colanic/teichoic acid biosynthesis glycosyltransferase|nr:sugar transferase [Patescibacteria group bacterium]